MSASSDPLSTSGASPAPKQSIFSPDTIIDLHAAFEEAKRGVEGADASAGARAGAMAFLRQCELTMAAVAASDAGRADEATRTLDVALRDATDLRLLFLGFQFHFRSGNLDEAERLVRRRLALAPPESSAEARACTNLGTLLHFRGDLDAAEPFLQRAVDLERRLANDFGLARALGNLSLVPESRKDFDGAERLLHEGLAIAERINSKQLIASHSTNLGEIAQHRGRHVEARTLLTRAARIFGEIGNWKYRAHCEEKLTQNKNT